MKPLRSLLLAVCGMMTCCSWGQLQAAESNSWKPTPEDIRSIAVQALQERETQTAGLCFRWGRCGYWPGYVSYAYYRPACFSMRYYAAPVYYNPPCYSYPIYSYSAYYPTYSYSAYYPTYTYPTYSYPAVYSYPTYYSGYSIPAYYNAHYAPTVVAPAPVYSGCYYW